MTSFSAPPGPSADVRARHAVRDVADVCDVVRDAAARRQALRIVGGGSWLDAQRPAPGATPLDLSAVRGIIEYTPGDLTLTARAGTPLAEIDAATRANGQWLPLDPFGDERATLGGTLATASAGPLAASSGSPRDLALGVEFVTGEGIAVRGGGRVVKNVAGFDLVRLTVGAWGTLGVITEATLRLRALPERDVTVAVAVGDEEATLPRLLDALRAATLVPVAMELVSPALAARLAVGDGARLLVRLAGNDEGVDAQRATLATLGDLADVSPHVWEALRRVEPPASATWRLSHRPSRMAATWTALTRALAGMPSALAHASVDRGIARAVVPAPEPGAVARALASLGNHGTLVAERLPSSCWDAIPSAFIDPLAVATRRAFDPAGVLNPGLLGIA